MPISLTVTRASRFDNLLLFPLIEGGKMSKFFCPFPLIAPFTTQIKQSLTIVLPRKFVTDCIQIR